MPYIKNVIEMPFIAKADVMKVGLNNLGNRNAAERLFTTLLPGMNNVTQRIRYYSFYCWLIKNFYIGEREAKESQFRSYFRNAEFLLALIHSKYNDAHGIPGTTTANTMVAGNYSANARPISLSDGYLNYEPCLNAYQSAK